MEYYGNIFQTSPQYFAVTIANAASTATYTISPALTATTKAFVNQLGCTYDTASNAFRSIQYDVSVTNPTTVTVARSGATGGLTVYGVVGEFR